MGENKQEILERVLLLMNYDNKRTLSENYSHIILEQISGLKIGQWVPNTDNRIKDKKNIENFVSSNKSR